MFQTNCTYNCWECTHMCQMVQMFRLPESVFYDFVLSNLKSNAGMLIADNYDYATVEQDLKVRAVSLKLAREQFLEKYHF